MLSACGSAPIKELQNILTFDFSGFSFEISLFKASNAITASSLSDFSTSSLSFVIASINFILSLF